MVLARRNGCIRVCVVHEGEENEGELQERSGSERELKELRGEREKVKGKEERGPRGRQRRGEG